MEEVLPAVRCLGTAYQNRFQEIKQFQADFGTFTKEYFVSEVGSRAGVVVRRGSDVLLVRQFRFIPAAYSWEIPGGRVDEGESPATAAIRECLEETGVRCAGLVPLLFYHPGLDTISNPSHLFLAEPCEELPPPSPAGGEVVTRHWIPLARAMEMVFSGEIVDAFTLIGLMAAWLRQAGTASPNIGSRP